MKKFFLILSAVLCLASCSKKNNEISFDDSDPLSLVPSVSWALIIEPYASYRKEPDWSSQVVDYCRMGEVVMIESTSIQDSAIKAGQKEYWYKFEKGWLCETSLVKYANKLKAKKAASDLLK
ncbi:MAG: hypothetical protein MJ169_05800 [Treponema sp.]|nr:hypothetical protein [Treponema sp.]